MYVKEIRLTNFRNYKQEHICFHPKLNIITGSNAQGKTNLLESISMMSMGKSFRTGRDSELIAFDEEYGRASVLFFKDGEDLLLEIQLGKKEKIIKINGMKAERNIDLLENAYIVVFSPEDLKIVKEEPDRRRKFIDRELCQLKPVYYRSLGRYKKILQQRNMLLKRGEENKELLLAWDEQLTEYGSRVIRERSIFSEKLKKVSGEIHRGITEGKEELNLSYEADVEVQSSLEEQRAFFQRELEKNRKRDFFYGSTSVGPHKDDWRIEIGGMDIRHYGSQGQQRTAALSLKLSELTLIKEETGEDAVLLLDDVLSELDIHRQRFLIQGIQDVQIFITAAELSDFLKDAVGHGSLFSVEQGKVCKIG